MSSRQRLLLPRHALHSAKLAIEASANGPARSLLILPNSVAAISEPRLQGAAIWRSPFLDFGAQRAQLEEIAIRSSVPIVARE